VFKHNVVIFFPRRFCSSVTIFALAIPIAFAAYVAPAAASQRGELVLATSAEDMALRTRLVRLAPTVNPEEARRVAYVAYTTGRELAREWDVVSSPTMQNFLIIIGARKAGYCFQFAGELLTRLDAQKLKTLELHWAESDPGGDTEHNVIVVTANGGPFAQGILLDNWRRSGHLLWGPVYGDPDHPWSENKAEFARRLKRRPPAANRPKR